jgi:hypothetical protein
MEADNAKKRPDQRRMDSGHAARRDRGNAANSRKWPNSKQLDGWGKRSRRSSRNAGNDERQHDEIERRLNRTSTQAPKSSLGGSDRASRKRPDEESNGRNKQEKYANRGVPLQQCGALADIGCMSAKSPAGYQQDGDACHRDPVKHDDARGPSFPVLRRHFMHRRVSQPSARLAVAICVDLARWQSAYQFNKYAPRIRGSLKGGWRIHEHHVSLILNGGKNSLGNRCYRTGNVAGQDRFTFLLLVSSGAALAGGPARRGTICERWRHRQDTRGDAQGIKPEPLDFARHPQSRRSGDFRTHACQTGDAFADRCTQFARAPMRLAIPFGTSNTLGCYLILFAQATTGAIASYLFWPVSVVHGVLSKVLLGLIVLHALAATSWHFFIERDGVMERMLYSRPFRNKCSRTVHSGP